MEHMESFYQFMKGYAEFMEEMTKEESEKHSALISYRLDRMDKAIAAQQAVMMRLEALEKQRIECQTEAGFGEMAFRDILETLEGADRERFGELFKRIENAVMDIKYLNHKSMSIAEDGLQSIKVNVPKESKGASYTAATAKGKPIGQPSGSPLFEAKI